MDAPRLALVQDDDAVFKCAYPDCPKAPTELVERAGVERVYCAGHALLISHQPEEPLIIDPLPEGALQTPGWLEGWNARRTATQAERLQWVRQGRREGQAAAKYQHDRRDLVTIAVACTIAFTLGFVVAAWLLA